MLKYALKSMWARKSTTILFTIALIVALTISMVAVNISSQISEGFIRADREYDIIIGPNGSETQLLMSTLFFADLPLGVISHDYVTELESRGDLEIVLPFALGDSYRGNNLVGTNPEFLRNKTIVEGNSFTSPFEVVVGYNVAKNHNLQIGDELITSHGVADHSINSLACLFHDHDDEEYLDSHDNTPYKVVGILGRDNSAYDNALYTSIESIWLAHNHTGALTPEEELVTAIIIRSGNQSAAREITSDFNSKPEYQAVHPTSVMRKLTTNIDLSKQVAFLLCSIILVLAFIIVCIMTMLMLDSLNKEVRTLRFLGLNRGIISKYVVYQVLLLGLFSTILSRLLTIGVVYVANMLSSTMGIVLDLGKVYYLEYIIGLVILALCLSPVFIYLNKMYKEALSNEK
ncbi:hypothetical protein HYG86_07760 [Alkalicella caledoniensis]|uniref:Putative hemin transport system permease protein HrtB n=1 Tax=Alkalicella caledoniensis TaxID=2731377 RepID=A0A7G9W7M7_ALKCA|nr:ABC transporter permease [Alkalicella caledoniensis]QNO14689.1 hypothetical protein HYG86_07760 [Alkalicella caledoniensis]